jgi:tetratricopeptide (TPR) repeat protein
MIALALSSPHGLKVLVLASSLLLATTQEQQRRERQVLDPDSEQWVETVPSEADGAPQSALDEARRLLAAGAPKAARKLIKPWLDEVPDEARYYEALWLLGETYFESGDYWKAVEQYDIVAENAAGELFEDANRRSVDVARAFLSGQKRILWKIFRIPAQDEAIEILDRVWERMPGSRLGEFALKLKADYFFETGEMDLAQDEYANLVQQYPSGRYVQLAMLRTAEAAEAAFPGIKFDATPLVEARERYWQVFGTFPAYAEKERVPERLEGIRQELAEKDLDIARWYLRTRQPGAAEFYYRRVIVDYPDTLAAADALLELRGMGVEVEAPEAEVERE